MLKFFRRIRQKMLIEGEMKNYIVYAIGEILLVMIGILLALQVSNWNEKIKNNAYVHSLIKAVEKDLRDNIVQANKRFEFFAQQDSISKLIINSNLAKDDFLNNESLRVNMVLTRHFGPATDNMSKLLMNEESLPNRYNKILGSIKILNTRLENLNQDFNVLDEVISEYHQYIVENLGPYKTDKNSLSKRLEYYLTDDFKNKLSYANVKKELYMFKIADYRSHSLWILTQLLLIEDRESISNIDSLFANLNLTPFPQVECNGEISNSESAVRQTHPIFNFTDKEIKLNIGFKDEEQSILYSVKPDDFMTIPPDFKPMNEDHTRVIKVLNNDNGHCIAKYFSRKNGYLILK